MSTTVIKCAAVMRPLTRRPSYWLIETGTLLQNLGSTVMIDALALFQGACTFRVAALRRHVY